VTGGRPLLHAYAQVNKELGLTATEAINLFYSQVKLHKGLPFKIVIPDETTLKVLYENRNA